MNESGEVGLKIKVKNVSKIRFLTFRRDQATEDINPMLAYPEPPEYIEPPQYLEPSLD